MVRKVSVFILFMVVVLFLIAAIAEIGGGYLIWLWLREGKSALLRIIRRHCISYLRYCYHIPGVSDFWPGIRRLWWRVHHNVRLMGMGSR